MSLFQQTIWKSLQNMTLSLKSEYYNFSEAVYIGEPTRFHRLFHIDEPANICENPSTDMYVLKIIKGYLQQHRTNAD